MTDREQLVDEQPGALGQLLVMAAEDEEPPASLLERTLVSVGVESGVALGAGLQAAISTSKATTVSSTAATVGVSSAPSVAAGTGILAATAKYAGLAAVGVLATGLALDAMDTPMGSPSAVESAVAPHGNATLVGSVDAPARAAPTEPEQTRTAPALPLPDRADTAAPASTRDGTQQPGSPSSLLREEAAVIDEAREAVATANPMQALRALEAHHHRFARPLFQPEALYLKMQALRMQGNERAARSVAEQLLAAYPNGAQASSARSFLKDAPAGGPSRAAYPE